LRRAYTNDEARDMIASIGDQKEVELYNMHGMDESLVLPNLLSSPSPNAYANESWDQNGAMSNIPSKKSKSNFKG